MYSFFSRNSFISFAALPLLLILFRLRLILSPEISFVATDNDLYTPIWNALFGTITYGSLSSVAIAIAMTFVTAIIVNSIVTSHFSERSNLGGMFFIILSSGFVISQSLHPINVFALLFAISIYRMFKGASAEAPMHYCFESGMLLSISYLFWAKSLFFLPLLIIMMIMLRMFNIRTLLATIMGLCVPIIVAATYYFYYDNFNQIFEIYKQCTIVPVAFYKTGFFARSYIIIYSLLLFIAILSSMRNMQTFKIVESRLYRVIIWIIFYATFFIMLPHFSFEMQILIATGGAVLLSTLVTRLHSLRIKEIFVTTTTIVAWIVQWYF